MRHSCSIDLMAIAVSLGCLPLMFLPWLPSDKCWFIVASITIILAVKLKGYFIVVAMFALSFVWSTATAKHYLSSIEPYIDQTLAVTAKVEGINTQISSQFQTDPINPHYVKFSIISITDQPLLSPISVAIYWDQPELIKAGQIWQLTIKTKAVHSYLNEGGFDNQRFAIANKSILKAKVSKAVLLTDKTDLRQIIVDKCLFYIDLFSYRDILLALGFGDRSQMEMHHRIIMMQTGVAHLMAISGMHILLVFSISYILTKGLVFCLPQRFNYFLLPIIIGWLVSLSYTWLTGFNPPALRAILALSMWIYLRYKNNQISAWQKINRIIALLLIVDPLMILSESFWMSCYAVVSLIFLFEWLPLASTLKNKKRWYFIRLLHLQFGLTLLLLPIQLFIFHGISVVALLTNLIAIPIVSLITFPAILLALLFSLMDCFYLALGLWFVAQTSLEWLFYCLEYLNILWLNIPADFYLFSGIGWITIIIIRIEFWRRFSFTIVIVITMLFSPIYKQPDYLWRVDMLDVGHGLAIVVHNGKSAILYDIGAKWEDSSAAEQVIIPFLQWHNLNVEGIIISHSHNDHIGGLSYLRQHYPDAWLMSSSSSLSNDYNCLADHKFDWQHLRFNVLWPNKLVSDPNNGDSCVIQITDGQFSVLLTGDLERKQEYDLVVKYKRNLHSTILQTPHHGSTTSSSYPFLNYVNPSNALTSTSRYNPWKLPSNKITNRYKALNINYYVTGKEGQISLFFYTSSWQQKTMRQDINPRWYHDWFGSLSFYE
ncbi:MULTISPECIES: DNA internalization-related competence protein ComEC/Rec2 [unclassified Gilliamella]|uniref:DNA internalization-related competence protein ComEC/Rec2 n=1 Tax=unclassified Gilliamella TaxID=2685620 RepID=UPI000A35775A|nr:MULTISPECIES: DNA internalization-related competence protein ComEC/Rec2 [unclassified Gilliamella]OTQ73200.1 DNA internalization-related competence protein ComEC/Rec2 [Gilliamella sp. N-G2]OTQ77980.1 DNA internalization-related competence protein ComEC/Rec2 [Gilliamella sp. N-W3]